MNKKTVNLLGTVLFILAFAAIAAFSLPRFFGVSIYCIMSDNMEPKIRVGSLAYASRAGADELTEEDIVVYRVDGETLTGRIASIDRRAGKAVLRGDSSPESEGVTVPFDDIRGKISLVVPMMGKLGLFANTAVGKVLFLGIMFIGARMIFYSDESDKKDAPPPGKKIFTADE